MSVTLQRIAMEFHSLQNATLDRDFSHLKQILSLIESNKSEKYLFGCFLENSKIFSAQLVISEEIFQRLEALEKMRSEVFNMKQSKISEMRSYDRPPVVVEKVIRATLLILGTKSSELNVRILY